MFKVGDTVVVINSGNTYNITKDDSIGIVISFTRINTKVEFKTIQVTPNLVRDADETEIFTIDTNFLRVTTPYVEQTQVEKVCAKIKQMEERRKQPATIPYKVTIDDYQVW